MSYSVAVRALCEFTAKEGDLDLRFTPAPTAAEGMAGHSTVVGRRGAGYVAELPLTGAYPGLLVSGLFRSSDAYVAQSPLAVVPARSGTLSSVYQLDVVNRNLIAPTLAAVVEASVVREDLGLSPS